MKTFPDKLAEAMRTTTRSPGWNARSPSVRRFQLGDCTLLVVPYCVWAYRRDDLRAAEWHRERAQERTA